MADVTSRIDPSAPSAEGQREPWYAPGLSFSCTGCGGCCTGPPGYVWFDAAEGRALAKRLGVTEREFLSLYAEEKLGPGNGWSLTEVVRDGNYDCVFLKPDGRGGRGCSVYEDRPTQCRTWPFWESNLTSPRAWQQAAEHCAGMGTPDGRPRERGGSCCGGAKPGAPAEADGFVPIEQIRIELARNPEGL